MQCGGLQLHCSFHSSDIHVMSFHLLSNLLLYHILHVFVQVWVVWEHLLGRNIRKWWEGRASFCFFISFEGRRLLCLSFRINRNRPLSHKCLLIWSWKECTGSIDFGSLDGSWTVTCASILWSWLLQHFIESVHWVFLSGVLRLAIIYGSGSVSHIRLFAVNNLVWLSLYFD